MSAINISVSSPTGDAFTALHNTGAKVDFSYAEGTVTATIFGGEGEVVAQDSFSVDYREVSTAERPFFDVLSLGDTRIVVGIASGGMVSATATEDGLFANAFNEDEDSKLDIYATYDRLGVEYVELTIAPQG